MKKIILVLGVVLVVLTGCKPTEKNYRSAYDAAVAKREKATADANLPADLILEDGPKKEKIGDLEVATLNERLSPVDNGDALGMVNVAVAQFKMPTNARSGAEALKEKGFQARVVKATGGRYFLLAGSYADFDAALECAARFRKAYPDYPYIGFQGEPVFIRTY